MIDIPGSSSRIMKGEVTVGLFKQVMQGYEITGHNADKLQAILNDPSQEGKALTYVNLLDAREFAKRLSIITGRKFRVQTEAEWLQAKDQLSGNNWTWTETEYITVKGEYIGEYVLHSLDDNRRIRLNPAHRSDYTVVRLVDDLPAGLPASGGQAGK